MFVSSGSELLRESDLRFHQSIIEESKKQVRKCRVWAGSLLTAAAAEGSALGYAVNELVSENRFSEHTAGMTGVGSAFFLVLVGGGAYKMLEASMEADESAGSREAVSRLQAGEYLYHSGGGAD